MNSSVIKSLNRWDTNITQEDNEHCTIKITYEKDKQMKGNYMKEKKRSWTSRWDNVVVRGLI